MDTRLWLVGVSLILAWTSSRLIETTGGGIGKACALLFAKEGAAGVMIADLDADAGGLVAAECRAVATNLEFRVEGIHIDVTLEASVKHATAQTLQAFGRIDYCVNCAGVSSSKSTHGRVLVADCWFLY
jgi:NAD(P)-dependent dehydrogenase (short-subunit alcohol dehydrogenase family)